VIKVAAALERGNFELDATFDAPERGVVALFGPSGCGKTTLVNVIAGLLQPERGRVEVAGEVLCDTGAGIHVPPEARGVGYVFQDARLFPHLTVEGNLRYGARRAGARGEVVEWDDVLDLLALAPLLARRPHTLSGGERQRVALGRALLAQPRLLLLDEPLASLDAARREEVLPYLEALRARIALPIVYVSHEFGEVLRLATHLVLLQAGRVRAQGPIADVSRDPALAALSGPNVFGAVIDARVIGNEAASGFARLAIGARNELRVRSAPISEGSKVRVQLHARDLILSRHAPEGLSVRNALHGTISNIAASEVGTCEVTVDLDGAQVVASITGDARDAMALRTGELIYVLVKALSLTGREFR